MTLLEILKDELPKLGGWPDGYDMVYQAHDYKLEAVCKNEFETVVLGVLKSRCEKYRELGKTSSQSNAEIVTKSQYYGIDEPLDRDFIINSMLSNVTNHNMTTVKHALSELYDAIAEGKIQGLKLEK